MENCYLQTCNLLNKYFVNAESQNEQFQSNPGTHSLKLFESHVFFFFFFNFYTAERKKELIPFATAWMELESIMLSEICQGVRDKYHMISPLTGT